MASEKLQMLAKTFAGLENILKEELIEIGATDVEVAVNEVKFSGSKEILYKANFCCRTALRILVIIKEKKVKSANDLYNCVREIEWSNYFDVQKTFSVISTVDSEAFNSSMIVGLKTKDAIVDYFKATTGKRSSVNAENPDIRINVHATADEVSISLDSSGESLHKRGYRSGQDTSVCEVLAAGLLKIAGWKGQCDFFDPMCGSGSLAIEAALIARKIPPGMFRKSFAFECWKDFDENLFDSIYNADYEVPFDHQIFASDISSVNVKIATENAKNAGLKKDIQFSISDFSSIKPEKKNGFILLNPPVAQRGNEQSTESLFVMIGETLKKNFVGFQVWIFSNSDDCFRNIGLRFTDRYELVNGTQNCEIRSYELYDGSKKDVRRDSFIRSDNRDEDRNQGRRFSSDDRKGEQGRRFQSDSRDGQPRKFSSDDRRGGQGGRFSQNENKESQSRRFSSNDRNDAPGRRFQSDSRDSQPRKFSSDDRREGQGSRFSSNENRENSQGRRFSSGEKREDRRFPSNDSRVGQRRFSAEERKEGLGRRSSTEYNQDNRPKPTVDTEKPVKRMSSVEKRADQERQFISSDSKENPKRKFTPGSNKEDNSNSSSEKRPKRPRKTN